MPRVAIDTIDDPRVAAYRDLPLSPPLRDSGLFIVEGRLLVDRLLESDYRVHSALVDARYAGSLSAKIPHETPMYVADGGLIEQIVGFDFHRGVMACGHRRAKTQLSDTLPEESARLTMVVCVGVANAENLGGVLRNCAALGADTVLLGAGCADPFSRRALRVSMGATLKLPLVESDDLESDLSLLRDRWGFQLAASLLSPEAEPLDQASRPERFALLLGGESTGLSERLTALCDRRITIAMRRGTDSLNVAVASGIFLYHFTR